MKVRMGARLIVQNPTQNVEKWCRDNLVMDNPEYYKKERMGKWTGNTPSKLYLFERMGDELWLPFGCASYIWRLCGGKAVPWNNEIQPKQDRSYVSGINLYPYQEKAVNAALRLKNGVLVMPCGSGKTQCGLEIISRIGARTLWLTHTQDLLHQSKKRAESVLVVDDPAKAFGTITEGKVNIGTHITFATIQTLSKLDLDVYRDQWDVIVVDECQHACGTPTRITQFYKVLSRLAARYKIGLTATPKRADGLERTMYALLGGLMCVVSREDVADTTCPIKVEQRYTGWYPDVSTVLTGDGTIDYHKVVENLVDDPDRFELVVDYISKIPSGNPVIVLANRISYLERLSAEYDRRHGGFEPSICLSTLGNSKKAKQLRKNALVALNEGDIDCIFATFQLAKEGLDVPNLRYVVFATPEKDETTVVQAVGRVGRKANKKEYGTVIDFIDDFGMYRNWAKKRVGFYRKLGAEVVE